MYTAPAVLVAKPFSRRSPGSAMLQVAFGPSSSENGIVLEECGSLDAAEPEEKPI